MILDKTYLGGTEIGKIYLGSDVVYEAGSFDSGLILNGTFDDATNLTLGSNWTVGGGVASFDGGTGGEGLVFEVASTIPLGTPVTLKFTSSNAVGNVRFKISIYDNGYGYDEEQVGFVTYAEGITTVSFTTLNEGGMTGGTDIRIICSSAAGSFDIDNVSLTID